MSRTQYHAAFTFRYMTDMFVLVFIAVILNIHNTAAQKSYIVTIILVLIILLVMSHFIVKKMPLSYVYMLIPVGIILLMVFGSYWLTALLVAGFSVWTLEQLHDNINNHFNEKLLPVMFILVLLINFLNTAVMDEYELLIHVVAISMFVFYFLGRAVMFLIGSGYKIRSMVKVIATITLFLLGLTAVISFVYKYAVYSVQVAFIFLLNSTLGLLAPFFQFLDDIELEYPEVAEEEMEVTEEGAGPEEFTNSTAEIDPLPIMTGLLILFALGVIIYLIIYFKNRGKLEKKADESGSYKTIVTDRKVTSRKKIKNQPPNSKVRKVYYSFEQWLVGRGLGRFDDETIDEWVSRVNLKRNIDNEVLEKYKKYRYDSIELTDEEVKEFKQMIEEFKKSLDN